MVNTNFEGKARAHEALGSTSAQYSPGLVAHT